MPPTDSAGQAAIQRTPALDLIARLGGRRAQQAAAVIAAGQIAAPYAVKAYRRLRRRDDYSVTVAGTDDLYPDLHEWVLARMPADSRKALIAASRSSGVYNADGLTDHEIQLRYDGNRVQQVTIDGHKVAVAVIREDLPASSRGDLPAEWSRYLERIVFTAGSVSGRDAVLNTIRSIATAKSRDGQPPALWMPSRWGSEWIKRGDLPPRSVDSAILKAGQLDRLIADMAGFLAAEDRYSRVSQPWHRGYLFHGAPGTGKTSVARALASYFGLATYYLPLGDLMGDTDLTQLVAGVQPRSVLLLEDVDAYRAATSRTENEKGPSIAAMLNALDGIWTPHGLITVMTTNHRDRLDPALVRAGRVDVDEEFTALDADQADRLAAYLGVPDLNTGRFVGRPPAELVEAAMSTDALPETVRPAG